MIIELEEIKKNYKKVLDSDVRSLISLHEKDRKTPGRPSKWLQAVNRSAIVLLTANTEYYIESLVCSSIKYLISKNIKATKYPENLRLWIFNESIQRKGIGINKSKEIVELSMKLWSEVRELKEEEINIKLIQERFSNPTPENINWVMSLFGINGYLSNLKITINKNRVQCKSLLGELARRRNKIAHGEINENPTIADIKRLNRFCILFSNQIKKDIEKIVLGCV